MSFIKKKQRIYLIYSVGKSLIGCLSNLPLNTVVVKIIHAVSSLWCKSHKSISSRILLTFLTQILPLVANLPKKYNKKRIHPMKKYTIKNTQCNTIIIKKRKRIKKEKRTKNKEKKQKKEKKINVQWRWWWYICSKWISIFLFIMQISILTCKKRI